MESRRRGRKFLTVLSIRSNGTMCQRVTAPLRYAAKVSRLSTVSDLLLGLNEKDMYPLFLLKHLSTVGINEGNITGLLIPPHQIPDRRLKPEVVPKCKG
jgi:hypothetical protein